jgi:hypothetical protein
MIPEDQLEITYVEFGPGSSNSGIPHRVDRSAQFLNEPTGQLLPIRRIGCSNPRCNMNWLNSKDYYSRGYSIESLIYKASETEKPILGERVYCSGREGQRGKLCDNFIEVTIRIKGVS